MSAALPLRIEGLTFRYHTRPEPALQDVSLTLEPGELVLVAGASGCGKTTLIRCINGLIPRTYRGELQGRILVYGQDARSMSMAQLSQQVGTLLQDPERQIVGSFVLNEVAFGLENLGLPRSEIRARVDEVLAYLGISHLRDRETFHLSGGEKQKVALAGVLAMRPGILLLDEPLARVDPAPGEEGLGAFRPRGHCRVQVPGPRRHDARQGLLLLLPAGEVEGLPAPQVADAQRRLHCITPGPDA